MLFNLINKIRVTCLSILFLLSCSEKQASTEEVQQSAADKIGYKAIESWRAVLQLNDTVSLPFNLKKVITKKAGTSFQLINGEEEIEIDEFDSKGDSLIMYMHIFDTQIRVKSSGEDMDGIFEKYGYSKPYQISFTAQKGVAYRFKPTTVPPVADISGKWEVDFMGKDGETQKSLGIFEQKGNLVTGTFLTTTGDYRFLEGVVDGNILKLSCFDGEHAFYFQANIADATTLAEGAFYSGKHWYQKWKAVKNEAFELPDLGSLTYLKEGYDKIEFSFPNLDSVMVSLEDPKYENKVLVVQLLGSWCPNCMDETSYLKKVYANKKEKGLEIIGLAYEYSPEFSEAKPRVQKMKERLQVPYELLIAGEANKTEAAKTLPMLNHIMSFPTTIVVDRKGKVRYIHTGFTGPGTGIYYEQFTEEFNLLLEKLLAEKVIAS